MQKIFTGRADEQEIMFSSKKMLMGGVKGKFYKTRLCDDLTF